MTQDSPVGPPRPSFNLAAQYVGRLRFGSLGAPGTVAKGGSAPTLKNEMRMAVRKQADGVFIVELTITARASRGDVSVFELDLLYGGLFQVRNYADEQLSVLLSVECPTILFPFARQVMANVTQQAGLPPLLMDPVDFVALYRKNLAAYRERKSAETR